VESGDGVHEDQRGVCALLCRADGEAAPCDGAAELSQWLRGHLSSRRAGDAAEVEKVADDFRELHERPVPQGGAGPVHRGNLLHDEPGPVAHLPDPDQARGSNGSTGFAVKWTPNVWMGVTVENDRHVDRIDRLREVPAAVRFLSLEPLLGPLPDLDLSHIDWVIVGGESGPGARLMDPAWVTDLRDQCLDAGVAFFFKQWGGVRKKKAGRLLEKRTWDQMPREAARA